MRKLLATFAFLLALASAGPAFAQDVQIREMLITVLDPDTKEVLAEVPAGGTVTLEVGSLVRLRLVAVPYGERGRRYPSARFEVVYGKARVQVKKVNEEVGNITLQAVRSDDPRKPHEDTVVTYEVLEKMNADAKMLRGHVTIEVVEAEEPEPLPEPLSEGVVLYDQPGFRGYSETFLRDDPRLEDNPIRDNAASSVRVAPNCTALLYDAPDHRGRWVEVTGDVADLGTTQLGSRTASSIQVRCRAVERRGVTLYADDDFRGTPEKFYDHDPRLDDNRIRNDSASSIRVDPGCRATLYEHASFQGRAFVATGEIRSLRNTPVGNDSVSSLRVECNGF